VVCATIRFQVWLATTSHDPGTESLLLVLPLVQYTNTRVRIRHPTSAERNLKVYHGVLNGKTNNRMIMEAIPDIERGGGTM
jgi:hypothetical protein